MNERLDVAYYYPAPYWNIGEGGWVKSLLLFFDKVSILLPGYMYGRHHFADPVLAEPLEDQGLLEVLEPKTWIDQEMAEQLAQAISGLLANGVFDDLPEADRFHELSQSRIGYGADVDLAGVAGIGTSSEGACGGQQGWRLDSVASDCTHYHPRYPRPTCTFCGQ